MTIDILILHLKSEVLIYLLAFENIHYSVKICIAVWPGWLTGRSLLTSWLLSLSWSIAPDFAVN